MCYYFVNIKLYGHLVVNSSANNCQSTKLFVGVCMKFFYLYHRSSTFLISFQ